MKRLKLVEYLPLVAIGTVSLAIAVRMHITVTSPDPDLPTWLGVPVWKSPDEMWLLQEIVNKVRPDLIVETGTYRGGTTLFLASLLEWQANGQVISIDITDFEPRPQHPRITYLIGSSVDTRILDQVKARIRPQDTVLVDLDSAHFKSHVLAELRAYAGLVSVGSYIVVEDTKWPRTFFPDQRREPGQAVDQFLSENPNFAADRSWSNRIKIKSTCDYLRRLR